MAATYLLGPKDHRHHALRLGGLGALINKDGTELHLGQPWVTSTHTGAADDICVLEKHRREDTYTVYLTKAVAPLNIHSATVCVGTSACMCVCFPDGV